MTIFAIRVITEVPFWRDLGYLARDFNRRAIMGLNLARKFTKPLGPSFGRRTGEGEVVTGRLWDWGTGPFDTLFDTSLRDYSELLRMEN